MFLVGFFLSLQHWVASIKEISKDIKKLVEEMIETMDACNGIGLAAPQIHHSIRLFIIRKPIENEENQYIPGEVKVFINPKIISPSSETWKAQEGCLSIPTIHADVERPNEIMVEYTNLEGPQRPKSFRDGKQKSSYMKMTISMGFFLLIILTKMNEVS